MSKKKRRKCENGHQSTACSSVVTLITAIVNLATAIVKLILDIID